MLTVPSRAGSEDTAPSFLPDIGVTSRPPRMATVPFRFRKRLPVLPIPPQSRARGSLGQRGSIPMAKHLQGTWGSPELALEGSLWWPNLAPEPSLLLLLLLVAGGKFCFSSFLFLILLFASRWEDTKRFLETEGP